MVIGNVPPLMPLMALTDPRMPEGPDAGLVIHRQVGSAAVGAAEGECREAGWVDADESQATEGTIIQNVMLLRCY